MDTQLREPEAQTFVETALKLGGKSEEEARTTGTIDRADDQVEALFAARYQTVHSPIHRAVWDHQVPVDLFSPQPPQPSPAAERTMRDSLEVARRHRDAGDPLRRRWESDGGRPGRPGHCRLLGAAHRPAVRRQGRVVRGVLPLPDPDGHDRADPRRAGVGPRLHRRRRSRADLRHAGAEGAVTSRCWPAARSSRPSR